jgi:hypothetical protein
MACAAALVPSVGSAGFGVPSVGNAERDGAADADGRADKADEAERVFLVFVIVGVASGWCYHVRGEEGESFLAIGYGR